MINAMSFDGGGVGGIFTAVLLERLERWNPRVLSNCHAFAGTSTGAIIACALALQKPIPPAEIVEFYRLAAPKVFRRKWIYRLLPLDKVFGTPYKVDSFHRVLTEVFGETRIGDLAKKVFIPTLDGDRRLWGGRRRLADAYFYNNITGRDQDLETKVVDALLASTAAPLYFSPYQNRFLDGGLVLNNPSIGLIAELMDVGVRREEIHLLSLGTGKIAPFIDSTGNKVWDLRRFIKPVVESLTNSNMRVSTKLARKMLDANYFRFAPALTRHYDLDEVKALPWIAAHAEEVPLGEVQRWLDGFFRLYKVAGATQYFNDSQPGRDLS